MTTRSLVIAVATYHRPDLLAALLPELLAQATELSASTTGAVRARVLVVDNDPEQSAAGVAGSFDADLVDYVVEPKPGISAARNRALSESRADDLLAFIDDDELPRDGWLVALVRTWESSGRPALVGGLAVSEFDGELDPWIAAGEFFRRRQHPSGSPITSAASHNMLLDLTQIRASGVTFDERFGLTGGSDTLFTRALHRLGLPMVWAQEAVVIDVVPRARMTRAWVLQRAYRHGNTTVLADLALAAGAGGRLAVRLRAFAGGVARMAAGSVRAGVGRASRSLRHQARGMRLVHRGRGMLAAGAGLAYSEYARETGGKRRKLRRMPGSHQPGPS